MSDPKNEIQYPIKGFLICLVIGILFLFVSILVVVLNWNQFSDFAITDLGFLFFSLLCFYGAWVNFLRYEYQPGQSIKIKRAFVEPRVIKLNDILGWDFVDVGYGRSVTFYLNRNEKYKISIEGDPCINMTESIISDIIESRKFDFYRGVENHGVNHDTLLTSYKIFGNMFEFKRFSKSQVIYFAECKDLELVNSGGRVVVSFTTKGKEYVLNSFSFRKNMLLFEYLVNKLNNVPV